MNKHLAVFMIALASSVPAFAETQNNSVPLGPTEDHLTSQAEGRRTPGTSHDRHDRRIDGRPMARTDDARPMYREPSGVTEQDRRRGTEYGNQDEDGSVNARRNPVLDDPRD